jgi:hypothetical protein
MAYLPLLMPAALFAEFEKASYSHPPSSVKERHSSYLLSIVRLARLSMVHPWRYRDRLPRLAQLKMKVAELESKKASAELAKARLEASLEDLRANLDPKMVLSQELTKSSSSPTKRTRKKPAEDPARLDQLDGLRTTVEAYTEEITKIGIELQEAAADEKKEWDLVIKLYQRFLLHWWDHGQVSLRPGSDKARRKEGGEAGDDGQRTIPNPIATWKDEAILLEAEQLNQFIQIANDFGGYHVPWE